MTTRARPTILLLFANDRVGDAQYLRNLPAEARRLEKSLEAPGSDLRVVTLRNVTRAELFESLREHASDCVGLHFGGHAHPDALYIEDDGGQPLELNMAGLAGWFSRMPRLRWVFLNGCATRAHIETIRARRRVPVIATDRAIRDADAAEFAEEFYACLAASWTLGDSFAAAQDRLLSHPGEGARRFLRPTANMTEDGMPWRLVGAEGVDWTLLAASGATTAGEPAESDLPVEVPEALTVLRAHLREAHATLVPFFQPEHGTAYIHEVYVELQVDVDPQRDRDRQPLEESENESDGPRQLTLARLMAGGDGIPSGGRWAVLGEPGAGKSTLARHLVWQNAADAGLPLTLYVGLAEFAEFRGDPFDFVQDRVEQVVGTAAAGITDALGTLAGGAGQLGVLFDGLDEVAPERLQTARHEIEAFARRWPEVVCVVCSRPIGYQRLAGFSSARLQALDTRQQRHLLDRWLGERAAGRAFEHIRAELALRDAASNPLLLSLMAKLTIDAPDSTLPASRSGLYGAALELLLGRGHSCAARGLDRHVSSARRLLGLLSLALTESGGERWRRSAIEETLDAAVDGRRYPERLLEREWETVGALLDRVAYDTGILGPHDGEGPWRYLHRSLRERLAAEALAEEGSEGIIARIRAVAEHDEQLGRWGETLGMACGLLDDPTAPLCALRGADEALTLRVLPELSGLRPAIALDVLFDIEPRFERLNHIWDGDTVRRLAAKWPIAEAVARLMDRVTPALDLDRLAFVHYALTLLGAPPERAAFFGAAGHPTEGAPHIPWVSIRPGLFRMGDPEEAVPVHITVGFDMAATPVTTGQYRALDPDHRCPGGAEHPVTEVSWWRAWLFAAWVGGELPSAAQWEHACRAGTTTRFWSGDETADLERVGWSDGNSGNTSQSVAQKPANPWGLYDMHGNVWEWCVDGWGAALQSPADGAPLVDPVYPHTDGLRTLRGGSYFGPAAYCRSARRTGNAPGFRHVNFGVRPVRPTPAP